MILAWDVSSSVAALLACISTLQTGRIAARPNANSLHNWSGLNCHFYPCLAASRNKNRHLQGFNGFSNVLPLHNGHDTAVKWSRWENFSKAWSCLRQIFKGQQNSTPFCPFSLTQTTLRYLQWKVIVSTRSLPFTNSQRITASEKLFGPAMEVWEQLLFEWT